MLRPFVPEFKPIQYYEIYEKSNDLNGVNNGYKGRFKYGFGKQFNKAQEIAAKNQLKLNQGDALDLFVRDRGFSTMEKVWGGMEFKSQPGVAVERGTLSELVLREQNLLSVQTRVINRCIDRAEDPYVDRKIRESYKKDLVDLEAE
ncbi:hypothetical protein LRP88_10909 [Fusarium phalaenopsidis]